MALVTDGLINQLDAEYVRDVGGFTNGQSLIGAFLPDTVDTDGWYGSNGYDCYLRDNAITIRPSLYFNTGVISPQNTNKYLTYENLTVIIAARRQGPAWGNQWMGLYSTWFNYNNNGASIFAITNNANTGGFDKWGTYGGITTTQSTSAMGVNVPVVLSTTFTSSGSGTFYTNGSNSGTYTSTKDQAYFGIGGLLPAKGSFVGDVFEVLVYNRILSDAEIQDSTSYLINKWFFYPSPTPSVTPTPTPTVTPSISITPTPSITPSLTPTQTPSVTITPTPSVTPSETPSVTPSITPSVTPSETPSVTPSITPSETPSVTPSVTVTPSETPSVTPSITITPSITPSETPSITPSVTVTPSETPSVTPSVSITPTTTVTPSPSITPSETPSVTPSPSPPPQSGIVTDGLQLFLDAADTDSYPGSGTTWIDLSPNAYSTTLVGAPTFNTTYFTFDGTTEYVDTNQSIGSETFSVGAWFRTSAAGIKMILSKETTAGWPWNYRIWLNGGQIIGDVAQTGGTSTSISTTLTNYNNGSWYYVMYTRDDSNQYLYVNGVEVKTTPDTLTGTIINAQEVWFGRSAYTQGGASPSGSYQYTGDIGQLFIYNRVLSASEILQNYNATKDTFIPPSPTPSVTPTPTPSVTPSISITPSVTPSITPSETPSVTPSVTPSETPFASVTPTATPSVTPSISITPTVTPSISITPSITPTPVTDTIRAALTGTATLTAYDAAPANTWIRIQGGEYAALMINVANSVKYWMTDALMQQTTAGGWSANFAQVLSADGVSAIGPVPTNSYLIAFSTRGTTASGSVAILSATSYKGLYTPVGTFVATPAAAANINYYYVRKTPTLSFTSNTHLGIRFTVGAALINTSIKSGGYDDTVPLSSWTSWDNTFIPIQAIATTTKGW